MPSTRRSNRKRQTTLSLTPLNSLSPAEASAHIDTQHAAVRYEDSSPISKVPSAFIGAQKARDKLRQTSLRSGRMVGPQTERKNGLRAVSPPGDGPRVKTGLQSPDLSSQPQQTVTEYKNLPSTGFTSCSDLSNPITPVMNTTKVTAGMIRKIEGNPQTTAGAFTPNEILALESDSDLEIKTPLRQRFPTTFQSRKTNRSSQVSVQLSDRNSNSSSEESVLMPPTKRRRLSCSAKPFHINSGSEEPIDEIAEDVEDLQGTELQDHRIRSRPVNNRHSKAMELLRRSRAKKISLDSVVATDNPEQSSDLGEESENSAIYADQGNREIDHVRPKFGEDLDVSDDEFVTSDEAAPLGAPSALADMPLEYTRHSHKPLKEHFKDAVEWLVHNKLNPAFPRDDPIYRIAFDRLDDEVKGYSGSKFISSAWAGDFARSLKSRPEFICRPIVQALLEHKCDACNRSGHPASWQISFSGRVYDKETLEGLADDSDDEDVRDCRGNYVPPAEKQYLVGRFCKSNAEMAHALLHWRYALSGWVLDWLSAESHTTPSKIVERENWSTRKRGDYANRVVDGMEDTGQIRALWRDWKIILDQARSKPARFERSE